MDQSLIDKMELENFDEGYEVMQELEGMHVVDEEIEDLSDAQEDILHGGLSETGRLVDIVELVEATVVPKVSASQPVNNHIQNKPVTPMQQQQPMMNNPMPKPVPSVNRPVVQPQRPSNLPKVNSFGNGIARKFS